MKGRHTSGDDGQRWAPNARQAALAIAPMAALVIAVGGAGAGLLLHRADVAAAAAGAGAMGVALEQMGARGSRRRLRQDRAEMRARIRELESAITALRRELDAAPSVLRPVPPPTPITGPLPLVDAFDRPAAPATPRSLPILTSNRRGLQSCAPGAPGALVPALSADGAGPMTAFGLPAQRPPATPITGLELAMHHDPSLPTLSPGPAAPVLATSGVPVLEPGPSEPLDALGAAPAGSGRHAGLGRHATTRPVLEPVAVASLHDGHAPVPHDVPVPHEAAVVDLRTLPQRRPATAVLSPVEVEDLVYASISAPEQEDVVLHLERPQRRPASLFEPVHQHLVPERPVTVDQDALRELAAGARAASRAMRPGLPPSPFFTPGAFIEEEDRTAS
ncbi:MAG: hypothetical protein JNL54_05420 [Kineosporiaceae bacterium]|nr:hypothetical protein [Kineosporiaceae bacterium]